VSSSTGADATQLVTEVARGDTGAAERLFPIVYDELRAIARHRLAGSNAPIEPTVMVHEAYLRLVDRTMSNVNSETHFKAVAARAMRFVLVDHYRRAGAGKRGGDAAHVTLHEGAIPGADVEVTTTASHLTAALTRLAEMDERKARVVELRFFAGLSMEETAAALGIARSTVAADWSMARAWLACELEDARAR